MAQCIISGKLTSITGRPLSLATVGIRLDRAPNDVQFIDEAAITPTEHLETTDEYGQFSVSLLQGALIFIRIEDLRLYKQVTVPNRAAATLEELLDGSL